MENNNLDRISMAYRGELGELPKRNAQTRINWICENAAGDRILDVGCSQGITSLLLGRKGKSVTGIDILPQQIAYAQSELAKEEQKVQKKVSFVCGDFADFDFKGDKFDTVIMGECLEHILNPDLFLDRAKSLLTDCGRLIVTVPFGVNPYPDHKRTYYFLELFKAIDERVHVDSVKFFGRWIGFAADCRLKASRVSFNEELLSQVENAFLAVDENNNERIRALKQYKELSGLKLADDAEEKLTRVLAEKNERIFELEEELSQSGGLVDDLRDEVCELAEREKKLDKARRRLLADKEAYNTLLYHAKRKNNRYERLLEVKLYNGLRRMMHKSLPEEDEEYRAKLYRNYQARIGEKERYCRRLVEQARQIPESNGSRYFGRSDMRIGIIADAFQLETWQDATQVIYFSPNNYKIDVDVLLIVSPWHGIKDDWTGLGHPDIANDAKSDLAKLIRYHRERGAKIVFYSKEDPGNYSVFLYIAKECDYIFTSEAECIEKYKEDTGNDNVWLMPFAVNPLIHNPIGFEENMRDEVIFAGTWGFADKYPERNVDLSILLDGVLAAGKKLRIFDRNIQLDNDKYKYPIKYQEYVYPGIEHKDLLKVHKLFKWAINVNSAKYTETMFASRVFELQACGSLILSNFSLAMKKMFPSVFIEFFPHLVRERFKNLSPEKEYALRLAGIRTIYRSHTVYHRLDAMLEAIGLPQYRPELDKSVLVLVRDKNAPAALENFRRQSYGNKELVEISALTEDVFQRADMFAYFDDNASYGEFYLEDMINGFKFTDTDFVTKDAHYENGVLRKGKRSTYFNGVPVIYRTVFWREGYDLASVRRGLPQKSGESIGYASDAGNYDACGRGRDLWSEEGRD